MKQIIFNILTICMLCTATAYAQPGQIQWQRTLGGDKADYLTKVVPLKNGGYVAAGYTSSGKTGIKTDTLRGQTDYWAVMLDDTGATVWQRTLGGSAGEVLTDVLATNDGGCLLVGASTSGISGEKTEASRGSNDVWIVKMDVAGNIEWQKALGGSGAESKPYACQNPQDSSYLIGCTSNSPVSGEKTQPAKGHALYSDYWIIKLDKNANILWDKTIGSDDPTEVLSNVLCATTGGYLISGQTTGKKTGDKTDTARGGYDFWVVRIDDTGRILWDKTIGSDFTDQVIETRQMSDGGFLIGGHTNSNLKSDKTEPSRGGYDYWLVKLNENGDMNGGWQRALGGNSNEMLAALKLDRDGGILVGGYSESVKSGEVTEAQRGGPDYWITKLDNTGQRMLWQKRYGDAYDGIPLKSIGDYCTSFDTTRDGGYIAGGYSYTNNGILIAEKSEHGFGDVDYWIIKLKSCSDTLSVPTFSVCKDTSYILPWGSTVKSEGVYYHKYYSVLGCDSTSSVEIKAVVIDTTVTVSGGVFAVNVTNASFQWMDCSTNQPVAGATKASFRPTKDGTYSVVINRSGCSATSGCHIIAGVGITNITAGGNIVVYPNPANNKVNISNPSGQEITHIMIADLLGRNVFDKPLKSTGDYTIDINMLPQGTYMLQVYTTNNVIVQKLQVIH